MITIGNLNVRLGGRAILDGASAALAPGSRVGLIGRNGAGKSTLMKVLVGQLDPDGGSIEMPRRTRLGYIAQEAPSGTMTPFEAVLAGLYSSSLSSISILYFLPSISTPPCSSFTIEK